MSTAELLHSYMEFRAKREQLLHGPSVEYYQDTLDKGIRTFFGVETGIEYPFGYQFPATSWVYLGEDLPNESWIRLVRALCLGCG
jgi:hypothetical protein